ncbi:MAG TPA: TIGR02206 family membrane protein [Saprospiraceae bacterium]|nr:TIGR02206 family membrane protein [Saprospiraceae bacterium]
MNGYEYQVYRNFSVQHYGALFVFTIIAVWLIIKGQKLDTGRKIRLFRMLSFIPLFALLLRLILDHFSRGLNVQDDLPLHLCRILAVLAPVIVYLNNSKAIKIYIYIALAGTLNAMITADPGFGFPHYEYFLYWIYHGGIIMVAFFAWTVMKVRLNMVSGLLAFLSINVYFVFVHLINVWLSSNYMYSRHKPPVTTLMDHLGEWPVYIFWLEGIAILLLAAIFFLEKLIFGKIPGNQDE